MEFVAGLLNAPLRATKLRKGWRTRWSVTLCGAMAILAVLDQVEPHLRTKRAEAAIFRAFCLTFPKRPTNRALSYAVLMVRGNLAKQLKAAKQEEWT